MNKSCSLFMRLLSVLGLCGISTLVACSGGGGGGVSGSAVNKPPVANAGPDQNQLVSTMVSLDGSKSTDADTDKLSYFWSFTSKPNGSTSALSDPSIAKPIFTPDRYGRYVIHLEVNDGRGNVSTDSITVTAGKIVMTASENDSNADGISEQRTTYTYNADGQKTKDESFDAVSGLIISCTTYTYDANANLSSGESDYTADGVIDNRVSYSYDAMGHLTMTESRSGDDTLLSQTLMSYASSGKLSTQEFICGENHEIVFASHTGTPNIHGSHLLVYHHYDDKGNESVLEYDSDADGVIESIISWTYDADGRTLASEYDANVDDDIIDLRSTNTFDSADHLTLVEDDLQADGVIDGRQTNTYDNHGLLTTYQEDNDVNDGIIDFRSTISYDDTGNKTTTSSELDYDSDGVPDWRSTQSYDVNGNITLYETDTDGDGVVDYRYKYTWERI